MAYWLVKSPFRSRTWARVIAAGEFRLYGIRNAQARNNIALMKPGDETLFYFRQTIWGIMHVASEPALDTTNASEKWLSAAFTPVRALEPPVTLAALKTQPFFQESHLLRQPRLSVLPVTVQQWHLFVTAFAQEHPQRT